MRLAQPPDQDLRQLFHHAPRQWRHRDGPGHRPRDAGCPWRRHPPDRFRAGNGLRTDHADRGCGVMSNTASNRPTRERTASALIVRGWLCLTIIACGLALRGFGFGLGLPALVVKYGGSMLWATMVVFLVAVAAPAWSRWNVALMSAAIAIGVELFRLVHAPWLDAFRLTMAGALLLGRIFSLWNLLAYGAGIGLAMWLDRLVIA